MHDGVVLSRVDLVAVGHETGVDGVLDHAQHRVLGPGAGLADVAVLGPVALGGPAALVGDPGRRQGRAVLEVEVEDLAHHHGLDLVDHELLWWTDASVPPGRRKAG